MSTPHAEAGRGALARYDRPCHRQGYTKRVIGTSRHEEDVSLEEDTHMGIIKFIGAVLGLLIVAAVVVPLAVLAGLFVWLKLTEEADEEALELEQEAGI